MRKLMDVARNRDLEIFEGQILAANSRMLELVESLGFEITNDDDDGSIKRATISLHKPS